MFWLIDLFGYLSVLLRAGTLILQSLLLGGVFFLLWVASPAPNISGNTLAVVQSSCARLLRTSAIGLAAMQGISLYIDSAVLMWTADIRFRNVIGANFFVAGSCIGIAAACSFFVPRTTTKGRSFGLSLLTAVILSASVMTSHAASRMGERPLLMALTFLHQAATGLWIGGLFFLTVALFRAKHLPTQWYLTSRFSRMALVCVGVLLTSGLAMSLTYIGSFHAMVGTAYGVMIAGKAVMLSVLILLGGINFLMLRNAAPDAVMPRLRRIVEAEFGIGVTIILVAVSATSQPPACDLVNQIVPFHAILERITPTWPRLSYSVPIPVSADGSRLDLRNAEGAFLTYKDVADGVESEANHHWMGLIVLAMGLLALLSKTGRAKWAEAWPLLLIGISIFIFVRADTESWPVGPKSFWASWLSAEVFQHRLVALACAGFGIFEYVRKRDFENNRLALVFPAMCALGGAVLMTHSHSITNVSEELLAELSHVPLGILAVLAGWSRWLEIRMPAANRRIPSWIWPACFVLIAAGLLNYREM